MRSLTLPFSLDGYGRVRSTTEVSKAYADRVRFALMTTPGERIMRPLFGSIVPGQSFELPDEIADEIEVGVRTAFSDFLPGLSVEEVSVVLEDVESGTVEIGVTYRSETTQDSYSSNLNLNI